MIPASLIAVFNLVVIDLVLSGDNAVVIALAVQRLEPAIARRAALWGAVIAVWLRVVFAALAAKLLATPLLQAIGGAVLFVIAYNLLVPELEAKEVAAEVRGFWSAVRVIVTADFIMSLDNILAVGGASHGNLALLVFGLAFSIPCVLFGAGLLAMLMKRFPPLIYVGAGVLAWTAGEMIVEDHVVRPHLASAPAWLPSGLAALGVLLVLTFGYRSRRKHHHPI